MSCSHWASNKKAAGRFYIGFVILKQRLSFIKQERNTFWMDCISAVHISGCRLQHVTIWGRSASVSFERWQDKEITLMFFWCEASVCWLFFDLKALTELSFSFYSKVLTRVLFLKHCISSTFTVLQENHIDCTHIQTLIFQNGL